ncbi:hypothetical protein QYE76_071663 [Lolium multiflorum]|uniref:F-box domain-containing protein n=1 Tax=Lolium multiflorum TaxID=4521 RepID=A0AAD8SLS2_LOLMU|nr:hypothetical protein QYE76_026965 [Lolium multiflorum]KAK1653858.1 hypothetical protein QYE76_071663 [Lolium multiflorum]
METETRYVPPELLVSQILPRLPVRSLLRFRCVCKAWRDTIDKDGSFHLQQLRLQKTALLLVPLVRHGNNYLWRRAAGLYRWERSQGAATLVHGMANYYLFRANEASHDLAHCDGLVLLPSEATVRVLNPATRRVLTLPQSPRSMRPHGVPGYLRSHQAFGLGHDHRTKAYKVARFFYSSMNLVIQAKGFQYTLGMEIFTVGIDRLWRDIKKPPPYPIKPEQTATFCKGSLFWTVEMSVLGDEKPMPGFVRLNLEDESFSVVPPPPCFSSTFVDYKISRLAELHGELCLAYSGHGCMPLEIWCNNFDDKQPRWDRRFVIALDVSIFGRAFCPKVIFDEEIVFQFTQHCLLRYNCQTSVMRNMVKMDGLRFTNPDNNDTTGTFVQYTSSVARLFDTIPYVPSLAPI